MRNKIIMVYPQLGMSGAFVLHAPLSLLYASIDVVRNGIDVEIFDTRLHPDSWQQMLKPRLTGEVLIVGISVMSGKPIDSAIKIGRFVKSIDPEIKIVWGGPHVTFFPDSVLEQEWFCDYVVSGYAVQPFYELVQCLMNNRDPSSVKGISYRQNGEIIKVAPDDTKFEFYDYRDIPYHLIHDYSPYGQLDQDKRIFSLFAFCSSPAQYSRIKGKHWVPLMAKEVVDHIEYLINKYDANYIYFIDDDSFVSIDHIERILDEIELRKLNVTLGFRGARINEIKKMSDSFIERLADAGTDILHIGAESGSNRILELMNKNCTVEDIIECNRKLSRHPQIIAAYNFVIGIPTETLEDLEKTRDLILRLVDHNPNCIIFTPNKYRPLPGTQLFKLAQKEWGYKIPVTLGEWTDIEAEGDYTSSGYTKAMKKFCDLLLLGSYFVDNKVMKVTSGRTMFYKFIRAINVLYGPVIRFRLRHGLYHFFIEYSMYQLARRILSNVIFQKRAI
jgi:radical SAM superfamily enzyme YgiQ (UPF0313 family)